MKQLVVDGKVGYGNFLPIPIDLLNTTSPVQLVSQDEMDLYNIHKGEGKLSQNDVDSPPITAEMQEAFILKYACDNWRDWATAIWGTDFDALQGEQIAPNKVQFYSADTIPLRAFEYLSKINPSIKIKFEYADEDLGVNVGTFYIKNGEVVDLMQPKPLSTEAYTMSIAITGDDFYVKQFLQTLIESEASEEFPEMCMEIAYNMRIVDEVYPTFILEQFIKWAVEGEEYEYASQIKKALESKTVN